MYELKVLTRFAAAHQLEVARKCENLHGHNWKVEVCVQGDHLDEAGVLIDFGIIKRHVRDIMSELDHQFLNELDAFKDGYPPSSENIARFVALRLQRVIQDADVKVSSVTAWESDDACATYRP